MKGVQLSSEVAKTAENLYFDILSEASLDDQDDDH